MGYKRGSVVMLVDAGWILWFIIESRETVPLQFAVIESHDPASASTLVRFGDKLDWFPTENVQALS